MSPQSCECVAPSGANLEVGNTYNCEKCGSFGWVSRQGEEKLSKIPTISDDGKLVEANQDELEFWRSLRIRPRRTRLRGSMVKRIRDQSMLSFLPQKVTGPKNQFDSLKKLLDEFGLEIKQLYDDPNINPDEPLLLSWKDWQRNSLEINESNDPQPIGDEGQGQWSDADKFHLNTLEGILSGKGFKVHQRSAINACMNNPGSLLITALPTGFGKTRIGQVITWLNRRGKRRGPTLLISPLIALMDDQREQFDRFNEALKAANETPLRTHFLTAADEKPHNEIMEALLEDQVDVLCCSPETLLSPVRGSHWVEVFLRMRNPFSLMVVDEAHTIGDWGASIRPEFQLLGWVKDRLLDRDPRLRVLLMSATITKQEETELKKLFRRGLNVLDPIREDRLREDLSFNVVIDGNNVEDVAKNWIEFLRQERGRIPPEWTEEQADSSEKRGAPPLLVYTPQKKVAIGVMKQLAIEVMCNGEKSLVKTYTGETNPDQRDTLRRQFLKDQMRVLVATSAFGMGIDKDDVWTISYLGMPFTLKGLYQGFGRAARKSNWPLRDDWDPNEESNWRSGNCLGVIPDIRPRRFNSQLGIKKTMERVWDMFYLSEDSKILENGYVIVPVISLDEDIRAYWSPNKFEFSYNLEEDEEDAHDDWSINQEIAKWAEENEKDRRKKMSQIKRRNTLFQYNMWTIACLQRTGKVEFLGLHHPILSYNHRDRTEKRLVDVLGERGYSGVIDVISDKNPVWRIPKGQTRLAVLRFKTDLTGHDDLVKLVLDGRQRLHDRHSEGRKELINFIEKAKDPDSCIRSALAPAIGLSTAKSCTELSSKGLLQMPCNHCRKALGFPSLEKGGFIWSSTESIASMRGKRISTRKITLSNADAREMLDLSNHSKIEAEIVRPENEIEISGVVSNGVLTNSQYKLFDIDGVMIGEYQRSTDGIDIPGVEWPESATGILFYKGQARIVTDSVLDP